MKRFYKPFEGIGIFSSCFSPNLNVIWKDYGLLLVILCLEAQMKNKCICGVCVSVRKQVYSMTIREAEGKEILSLSV